MGHPFSCSVLHAFSPLATFLCLPHPFSCPISFVRLGKETVQQAVAFFAFLRVVYHERVTRASASFCPPESVKVNETLVFSLVVMFKSTVPSGSFVKLTFSCLNYVKQHQKPSHNIRLRCLFHVKRQLVWENSLRFAMQALVSRRNDVWWMSGEILYSEDDVLVPRSE